ncbi:MAG: formylglycine-generating enzyme family protein [Alphaproteobacteria bacterium]
MRSIAAAMGATVLALAGLLMAVPATAKTIRDCPDCPQLTVIPAGSYTMGSPGAEEGAEINEGPQRRVDIAYRLAVGTYEVTVGQFRAFVKATKYAAEGCWLGNAVIGFDLDPAAGWWVPGYEQTEDSPVVCVNWDDAQAYLRWLSQKTGKPYRLLTEAEWEYVARAGATGRYPWGEQASRKYANFGESECCAGAAEAEDKWVEAAPVGSFPPNKFGVHDMLGNVWEWVEDCWHQSYAKGPVDGSAWIKAGLCETRGVRGGSWFDIPDLLRLAYRHKDDKGARIMLLGFRVARPE